VLSWLQGYGARDVRRTSGAALCVLISAFVWAGPAPLAAQERALPAPEAGSADRKDGPDDLSGLALEDLLNVKVYAASKFVQEVAQAPASVTIVSSDEIRRQGYRTLADLLRSVRGFYVTSDRDYSYVGVRGFLRPGDFNGRVLVLVNGHRMNDTIYEQALLGTESPIDINLVDRVEVIRGPSSSLYGTSAFFAVVNVITRTGRSLQGVEVEAEGGSQAMRRGRVLAGGRNARGLEGVFAVSAFASDGNPSIHYPEFDTPAGPGNAVDADGDRSTNLFARGSAGHLSVQAAFGTRTKHVPTAAFDTLFNDARLMTRDVRAFVELQYSRRLDPRTTVDVHGSYDQYDYNGEFPYASGVFHDEGRSAWVTTEGSVAHQFGRHALTAGAEYRQNLRQNQFARGETGVLLDDRRRFALIVTPVQGSTLKALYGRAFRAPNPFELYYDQNAISAQLKPEHINTAELIWEQRLTPRLQASASYFRNRVSGLIVQRSGTGDTLDGLYYVNGDSVSASGAELELQGELPGHVHTRVSQSFQAATRDATGQATSNSPRVLSTLVVDAPLPWRRTIVAFNAYGIGVRRGVQDNDVPGAFVANVSISRRPVARGLGAALTIYNVFGSSYSDPGSVEHRQAVLPQDGRTASVRVSWRF